VPDLPGLKYQQDTTRGVSGMWTPVTKKHYTTTGSLE
jgi:hypothetical protein